LEEVDQNVSMLHKLRHQLNTQLEDLKKTYEEEAKERQSLLGRYRNLKHEQEGLQAVYEEELAGKENLARQVHKAEEEMAMLRLRYTSRVNTKYRKML
jgi:myosin protein heavy chain